MDKYRATIYILVYNNVDELDRTVQGVIEQDYENVEVIISDDGSTKYDTAVLNTYAEKIRQRYKDVKVNINQQNVGTVKHLNKVFKLATGDIFITCSSGDCFKSSSAVSDIVKHFEKTGELIATARRIDRYNTGDKVRPGAFLGLLLKLCPRKLAYYMIRKKNLISGACTYYRRELFEKYGYHDEDYHLVEDYPYYVSLLLKGEKIGFINKPVMIHTIGGVSTGKIHPSIYKDIELMREKLYQSEYSFDAKTKAYLKQCHDSKMKDNS